MKVRRFCHLHARDLHIFVIIVKRWYLGRTTSKLLLIALLCSLSKCSFYIHCSLLHVWCYIQDVNGVSVLYHVLRPLLDLKHWEVLSDGAMIITLRYGNVLNVISCIASFSQIHILEAQYACLCIYICNISP